jgi:hypothetical protein
MLNKLSLKKNSFLLALFFALMLFSSFSSRAVGANLIVPIAGITQTNVSLTDYVTTIYTWGIGLAALLAVLMIVIGGAQYIFAAGSFGEAEAGKSRITSAIYGIILLLGISLILSTVGVRLRDITLDPLALDGSSVNTMDETLSKLLSQPSTFTESSTYDFGKTASLNELSKNIANAESGLKTNVLTDEQYSSILKNVNTAFNKYYDDPALFAKMKKANEDAFKASGYPYTEAVLIESTKEQIKTKKDISYGLLINDLKDKKHPEILAQKKINSSSFTVTDTTTTPAPKNNNKETKLTQ